jgi:hypothetical protein
MSFRGNELKVLLKIKELAFSRAKNELVFEGKIYRFKPKSCHLEALPAQRTDPLTRNPKGLPQALAPVSPRAKLAGRERKKRVGNRPAGAQDVQQFQKDVS